MRFNVNNADTVKRVCNKYYPFIRLSTKGATAICMDIVKELGLEQGDTVSFLQNKEEPKDWYLLFGDKNGFVLRGDKKSKSLFFNQTENARIVFKSLALTCISARFKVDTTPVEVEGMKLYAMLTLKPIIGK